MRRARLGPLNRSGGNCKSQKTVTSDPNQKHTHWREKKKREKIEKHFSKFFSPSMTERTSSGESDYVTDWVELGFSEFSYRETEDDELQPDVYYQNLPRFKQQYNKDFKCFITDQLRPINTHCLGLFLYFINNSF